MSDRLRDNPDELGVLADQASTGLGVPAAYVEKDFWVTEVLRIASAERQLLLPDGAKTPVSFIFKGGTSLSRVFGLIDRFSEDVDLLAAFPEDSTLGARHRILKQVHGEVMRHLGLPEEDTSVGSSTTGVKRYTTYRYPTDSTDTMMKDGVVLELGSRGGAYPASEHIYRSMVAEYAVQELGETENTWEELRPFQVNVLDPERTLLEKIAAVHDAACRNDEAALLKHGRHFYDIERLLRSPEVVSRLRDPATDIVALVEDINTHSRAAGFTWTPRPEGGYADSPAFDPQHVSRSSIDAGYESAQALIHGKRVPLEHVTAAVGEYRHVL